MKAFLEARTGVSAYMGVLLLVSASAQDGSLDMSFNPGDAFIGTPSISVTSMETGPDGNIWMCGAFTALQGGPANAQLARLDANAANVPSLTTTGGFTNGVSAVTLADQAITPDGKIIVVGDFTAFQGITRHRIARLNADGSLDPSFDAGTLYQNTAVSTVAVQSDGKPVLLLANSGRVARLETTGVPDPTFTPGTQVSSGGATQLLVQPDGRIIIMGSFPEWGSSTGRGVARILSNGLLDPTFNIGTGAGTGGNVVCAALDDAGRVILGGTFTSFGGYTRNYVVRLLPSGAVDTSFDPNANALYRISSVLMDGSDIVLGGNAVPSNGATLPTARGLYRLLESGAPDPAFQAGNGFLLSGVVTALLKQADGSYLVAGSYRVYDGHPCNGLVRIAHDGAVSDHLSRNPAFGFDNGVTDMVIQPDGRIIAVGEFLTYSGQYASTVCRLLPNGLLDPSFNPVLHGSGINGVVLQPDGKVLACGSWIDYSTSVYTQVIRLHPDGSIDPTFNVTLTGISALPASASVRAMVLRPDGRILIGGQFTAVNGVPRSSLALLEPNGSVNTTFAPTTINNYPLSLALQPDGKVVVGFNIGGPGPHVRRYNSDGAPDAMFSTGSMPNFPDVRDVVVQPDGKLLVCGYFQSIGSTPRIGIARLNTNGSVDLSFNTTGFGSTGTLYDIELTASGSMYVCGTNGAGGSVMVRLNPNGSNDPTFNAAVGPGISTALSCLLLPDGRVLCAGRFTNINGVMRTRIARLNGPGASGVRIAARAFLQGPYDGGTQRMGDALRVQSLVPASEPYTAAGYSHMSGGGESVPPAVFATTGDNAIVDWVVLELRDPSIPADVVATRSALIQSDGDIVDADAVSPVYLPVAAGTYHVAVHHRNHLGIMTAAPLALTSTPVPLDFTLPSTPTFGTDARSDVDGTMVQWCADVLGDGSLKYTGAGNDRDPILVAVGSTTPNATTAGYRREDVNLDGVVKYTGSGNDRDRILVNVGSTTPNNVRQAQLP